MPDDAETIDDKAESADWKTESAAAVVTVFLWPSAKDPATLKTDSAVAAAMVCLRSSTHWASPKTPAVSLGGVRATAISEPVPRSAVAAMVLAQETRRETNRHPTRARESELKRTKLDRVNHLMDRFKIRMASLGPVSRSIKASKVHLLFPPKRSWYAADLLLISYCLV